MTLSCIGDTLGGNISGRYGICCQTGNGLGWFKTCDSQRTSHSSPIICYSEFTAGTIPGEGNIACIGQYITEFRTVTGMDIWIAGGHGFDQCEELVLVTGDDQDISV